jgi:hypothetical protein
MHVYLAINRNFNFSVEIKKLMSLILLIDMFCFDNLHNATCQHTARTTAKRIIR